MDMPTPQIVCLAQTIHGEARGESLKGQRAVGQVVINRTKNPRFPSSICKVVRQAHQFTGYKPHIKPSQKLLDLAKSLIKENNLTKFLYFNTAGPRHAVRIGHHFFW